MLRYDTFAGGQWKPTEQGFATFDPASAGRQVGQYSATAVESIDPMLATAQAAQADWARRPALERVAVLREWLGGLRRLEQPLAEAIVMEQGKPLAEARGEVAKSLQEFECMLGHAAGLGGTVAGNARAGVRSLVLRRPRGVIAGVTPWNFPILTPLRKIAPALAFGNAIVLKPSELSPGAACLVADSSRDSLPAGLLQLVLGGADVGRALVANPRVAGVTFTGSVATGKAIYAMAAGNLTEVSLELGGKNAAIVDAIDDPDACLDQIVAAAFACSGQRCTAISRVIVVESRLESVIAGLKQRIEALRPGPGMQPGVTLGPLVSAAQRQRVQQLVERGLAESGQLVTGGGPATEPGLADGHFYQPTLIRDVEPGSLLAQEEIFGPVLSVLSCRDMDEALTIANGVAFGLTAALFSSDPAVIERFLDASETGMLHVNHGTTPESHMPFLGIKASGVGACSVGPGCAAFYTTEHAAYVKPAP